MENDIHSSILQRVLFGRCATDYLAVALAYFLAAMFCRGPVRAAPSTARYNHARKVDGMLLNPTIDKQDPSTE